MNVEQVTLLLLGYALFGIWGAIVVGAIIALVRAAHRVATKPSNKG